MTSSFSFVDSRHLRYLVIISLFIFVLGNVRPTTPHITNDISFPVEIESDPIALPAPTVEEEIDIWKGEYSMRTLTQAELVNMVKARVGTIVYTEGQYGAQCVGFFKWVCSQLGIPVLRTVTGYAAGYWTHQRDSYAPYFEFVTGNYQDGDILIWPYGYAYTPYSHIGMKIGNCVVSQNQGSPQVTMLDQSKCPFAGAYGAFRYKGLTKTSPTKSIDQVAQEVIQGLWGNGAQRKQRLEAAGYNYATVQAVVNQIVNGTYHNKTNEQIAKEVIAGKWGNGTERKTLLSAAGYDYSAIQKIVNQLVKTGASLKVGSKVRVKQGANQWGKSAKFAAKVYNTTYKVTEIIGNRAVFATNNGVVIGATHKDNLTVV